MIKVITNITFIQNPAFNPKRTDIHLFDFVADYEAEDYWETQTNKCKITLPKNVLVKDKSGKPVNLFGTNINMGGFSNSLPIFMRGDQVIVESGYQYPDSNNNIVEQLSTKFIGYIANVSAKMPITLECEDSMWILKQYQMPVKLWKGGQFSVEQILQQVINSYNLNLTVYQGTQTSIGDVRTGNETISEFLGRLKRQFNYHAYFRNDLNPKTNKPPELRCGSFVYIEQDAIDDGVQNFKFQQNIISDELAYKRKDDIVLSAVATNVVEENAGKTTKDGQAKLKKVRLEVLVTFQSNGQVTQFVKTKGVDFPPNQQGERMKLFYTQATTIAQLVDLATRELQKYYYTGFRGKFTAFGIPFVRMGDNITIQDPILPERNGSYKVKGVKYMGGTNGLRQEIELAYLLNSVAIS